MRYERRADAEDADAAPSAEPSDDDADELTMPPFYTRRRDADAAFIITPLFMPSAI